MSVIADRLDATTVEVSAPNEQIRITLVGLDTVTVTFLSGYLGRATPSGLEQQ